MKISKRNAKSALLGKKTQDKGDNVCFFCKCI